MASRGFGVGLAPHGIRVNTVEPALMLRSEASSHPIGALFDEYPIGRIAGLHEIASAVPSLSSGRASQITGAAMVVNGGDPIAGRTEVLFLTPSPRLWIRPHRDRDHAAVRTCCSDA